MTDTIKSIQKAVGVTSDGKWGPNTSKAVCMALSSKDTDKAIQKLVGVTADGIVGNNTVSAIANALGVTATKATTASTGSASFVSKLKAELKGSNKDAPTCSEIRSDKSIYGAYGDESNLTNIVPVYPLYYSGKAVKSVRVHKKVAEKLAKIFEETLAHYGQENITRLGLDVYDGSFYARKVRGGGSASMHSWGIAFDFNAAKNGMRVKAPKALFSGEEYEEWYRILYRNGARSFGLENDYDYMHVEFARV